MTSSNN